MADFLSSVALRILGTRASIAELEAINTTILNDGAMVFVTELSEYYSLRKGSTDAPDGVNIVQSATGSPGRWFRQNAGNDPVVATQTDWYVDPQNVTGTASDTNAGATSSTALRTYSRLSQLLDGAELQQGVDVHQISSPTLAGDTYYARTVQGGAAFAQMRFIGEASTSFDTVVLTAVQDNDPVAGDRPEITVAGFDFTPHLGRRVRILAGSNPGSYAWIWELGGGVDTAVLASDAINPNGFSLSDFQVGDSVVIEELTEFCQLAAITDGVWYSDNPVRYQDLAVGQAGQTFWTGGPISFLGCHLRGQGYWPNLFTVFAGCRVAIANEIDVSGDLFLSNCWIDSGSALNLRSGNTIGFNAGCASASRLNLWGHFQQVSAISFFGWPSGAALVLFQGSVFDSTARLWGSSSIANTFGIQVNGSAQLNFTGSGNNTPTVAGTLSGTKDLEIGDTNLTYAQVVPGGYIHPANLAAMVPRAV